MTLNKRNPAELAIDIETAPIVGDRWSLFSKSPMSLNQVREFSRMICFSAQWHGDRNVMFFSEFHDGREAMLENLWNLMDEADIVATWNGDRFDLPKIRWNLKDGGYDKPYSEPISLDLMKAWKRAFGTDSNKLQFVADALGIGAKVTHEGHGLWTKCMAGDASAWNKMRTYAKQDTRLLWKIHDEILPWIKVPNRQLFGAEEGTCPNCASDNLQRRGFCRTALTVYQRFVCNDCGRWSRGKHAVDRVEERAS